VRALQTTYQWFGTTTVQIVLLLLLILIIAAGALFVLAKWRLLADRTRLLEDRVRFLHDRDRFFEDPSRYRLGWRDRPPRGPRYPLWDIIDRAADDAGIVLTWGAREMLSIPVAEILEMRDDVNWGEVNESVQAIVRTMAEESQPQQLRAPRTRDSVAVIRGFSRRFCNIPPFCSRDDDSRA
jgi:hypothetical protein